jgi:hypothetical protein
LPKAFLLEQTNQIVTRKLHLLYRMTGAALVGIARNTVFVQTGPVSQDYSKTWGMGLAGVQTTGVTMTIMEGIDLDEIVVVEADRLIAEAVEATETTMTTTRGATLEKENAAIMITTMGEVVREVIAEIVTGDVRTEGTVRRGGHREIEADHEIETGRGPVDDQEVALLEDQGVDQEIGVIVRTVIASDGHQAHSTTSIETKNLGTLIEEQRLVLAPIYRAEQTAAPMERIRSHANVAAVVARGAGRVARRSAGLVVEAAVLLPVLKASPESNCFILYQICIVVFGDMLVDESIVVDNLGLQSFLSQYPCFNLSILHFKE